MGTHGEAGRPQGSHGARGALLPTQPRQPLWGEETGGGLCSPIWEEGAGLGMVHGAGAQPYKVLTSRPGSPCFPGSPCG